MGEAKRKAAARAAAAAQEHRPHQPIRIAHIGNIAANAYLNAKFQRRLGAHADSFDLGGGQPMWLPWWEEADFDPTSIHPSHYDWLTVADATGVRRPAWAKILGVDAARPWYDTQEQYQADFVRLVPGAVHGEVGESQREHDEQALAALAASRLTPDEQAACLRGLRDVACWRSVRAIAAAYDLVVLYGPFAAAGAALPRPEVGGKPYVTFEHSTMRTVPTFSAHEHHLLAASYRYAAANVLTNADCAEAAWSLGLDLDRCHFIPHPVDTEFFRPEDLAAPDPEAASVRERLREGVPGGVEALFFAPARQSRSALTGAKRNDRVFHAFRRYLDEAEPAGAPRAALLVGAWGDGDDLKRGLALVQQLGLNERVIALRAQPKRRMRALYHAADVVLDQFAEEVGSFGTITAEALACGKPVITYLNPDAHAWCLPALGSLPPVCQARTAPEIYDWLCRLAPSPEARAACGARARAWVDAHHSWQLVAARHLALYARVLGVEVANLAGQRAPHANVPRVVTPVRALVETDCGLVGVEAAGG